MNTVKKTRAPLPVPPDKLTSVGSVFHCLRIKSTSSLRSRHLSMVGWIHRLAFFTSTIRPRDISLASVSRLFPHESRDNLIPWLHPSQLPLNLIPIKLIRRSTGARDKYLLPISVVLIIVLNFRMVNLSSAPRTNKSLFHTSLSSMLHLLLRQLR